MKDSHVRVLLAFLEHRGTDWSTESLFNHFKDSDAPLSYGVVEYALKRLSADKLVVFEGRWCPRHKRILRKAMKHEGDPLWNRVIAAECDILKLPAERRLRADELFWRDIGFRSYPGEEDDL